MLVTTALVSLVMLIVWAKPLWMAALFFGFFFILEGVYFTSTLRKVGYPAANLSSPLKPFARSGRLSGNLLDHYGIGLHHLCRVSLAHLSGMVAQQVLDMCSNEVAASPITTLLPLRVKPSSQPADMAAASAVKPGGSYTCQQSPESQRYVRRLCIA